MTRVVEPEHPEPIGDHLPTSLYARLPRCAGAQDEHYLVALRVVRERFDSRHKAGHVQFLRLARVAYCRCGGHGRTVYAQAIAPSTGMESAAVGTERTPHSG